LELWEYVWQTISDQSELFDTVRDTEIEWNKKWYTKTERDRKRQVQRDVTQIERDRDNMSV
jgi:hypothetical protein